MTSSSTKAPDGPGVPHVDALLGDLGEQLPDDAHGERWRREVAQRARVVGVELVRREPLGELGEDRRGRAGFRRCWGRPTRSLRAVDGAEERPTERAVLGRLTHRPAERLAVDVVEGRRPGGDPEALERGAGCRRVADPDELGLRVPGESRVGVGPGGGSVVVGGHWLAMVADGGGSRPAVVRLGS